MLDNFLFQILHIVCTMAMVNDNNPILFTPLWQITTIKSMRMFWKFSTKQIITKFAFRNVIFGDIFVIYKLILYPIFKNQRIPLNYLLEFRIVKIQLHFNKIFTKLEQPQVKGHINYCLGNIFSRRYFLKVFPSM